MTDLSILRAAQRRANLREIAQEVTLSSRSLMRHISELLSNGLLSYDEESKGYTTTAKGLRLLRLAKPVLHALGVELGWTNEPDQDARLQDQSVP